MDTDNLIVKQQREIETLQSEISFLKEKMISYRESGAERLENQELELIIKNCNAILFRRLASADPKKRKMVYVSPNISRFGYFAEDFLSGKIMFRDLVYSKDSPRTLKEIQKFIEQGIEEYTQFYRIVTKQKEVRWVEDRTSIYEDQLSGQRYHQGLVIDIHERKTVEEKLKNSEEKHRRVIETTSEGFLLLDHNCTTIDLNAAYEQLAGSSRTELLGRKPKEITPDLHHYFKQLSENDANIELEGTLTNRHGRQIPILIHIGILLSDDREPLGAAAFITNISSQKKALRLAAEVQHGFLPIHPPEVNGFDIAGTSIPCDEVGGDFFDFLPGAENSQELTAVIGDVSGHGVDAALLVSSARSYLRAHFSYAGSSESIIESLNQHLAADMMDSGRFMTLFYLVLRHEQREFEWIRAGHDPALLYDQHNERFTELKGPGTALGISPDLNYQAQRIDNLSSGQIIFLGTDGIWEATNKRGEVFGKQEVRNLIKNNQSQTAKRILEIIINAHKEFTSGTVATDDLTAIVIKVK